MKFFLVFALALVLFLSGSTAFAAKGGIKGKPVPPDGGEYSPPPSAQPFI